MVPSFDASNAADSSLDGPGRPLRRLGALGLSAPANPKVRFFVTGPNVRRADLLDHLGEGPFHAKEMGTTATACGQQATSWAKFWNIPFSRAVGDVCTECRRVTSLRAIPSTRL